MRTQTLAIALLCWTGVIQAQGAAPPTPVAVVTQNVQTFNRHDLDAYMALHADTMLFMGLGDTVAHHVIIREGRPLVAKLFADNPHLQARNVTVSVTGPFVITHEHGTGYADGRTTDNLEVYEVVGGKIVAEWQIPAASGAHW